MSKIDKYDPCGNVEHVTNNDIDRDVYCLLGLVFDSVGIKRAAGVLHSAASQGTPYLLSTPNINFMVNSQRNREFREAVLLSELSVVDGMPLIWIARILGVPLPERVAGSDLFEALSQPDKNDNRKLSVFFFGGASGVGEQAGENLNSQKGNVTCVGSLNPGFGSVDEISGAKHISRINKSNADFLVVALGAVKGHLWLEKNKDVLKIPLRSHLGAVINFEAGTVKRTPEVLKHSGLEWLWRLKEEPWLWHRYWSDSFVLMATMFTKVFPLAAYNFRKRHFSGKRKERFSIACKYTDDEFEILISGDAGNENLDDIRTCFKKAVNYEVDCILNLKELKHISSSCLGTVMMLRKVLLQSERCLRITNASSEVRKLFRWYGLEYLLDDSNNQL